MIIKLDFNDVKNMIDEELNNTIQRIIKEKIESEIKSMVSEIIKEKYDETSMRNLVNSTLRSHVFGYHDLKEVRTQASEILANKINLDDFLNEDFKNEIISSLNKKIKLLRFDIEN